VLLIAYAAKPVAEGQPVDLHELDVIAGRNFLLTFHGGAPIDAAAVARRVTAHPELAKEGSGFLLYVVLDEVVDTFFPTSTRSASGSRTWRRRCSRPPSTSRARSSPCGAT